MMFVLVSVVCVCLDSVAIDGTPLGDSKAPTIWDMTRMIATARIIMPKTMVRLSAGTVKAGIGLAPRGCSVDLLMKGGMCGGCP